MSYRTHGMEGTPTYISWSVTRQRCTNPRAASSNVEPNEVDWSSMNDKEEQAYIAGKRMAWRRMLDQCIRELGDAPNLDAARLLSELEETRAALRRICADHGDNEWPDDLSLADVIEKHLARHLDD